ncbi:MAG TPA: rhodanese-like domain-containing protein [Candidatus Binatia bacterium]|nr:rhodanese-like domain-containing protein [Candidatus Binatia bacterium]
MATTISAPTLKTLMEGDTLYAVLDVRDWGEFTLEQIPRANSLPRGHLEKYITVLVPKKDVHVILYCDTGQRSIRAAATLESLGYTNVSVLAAGLQSWKAADYETIHGWSLRGKEYGERLQVEEGIPDLTVEDLHAHLARGEKLYILDTRTESEFLTSHLPGAYSVPGGQLALTVTDIVQDRPIPIVTNCAGRTRSLLGAHLLRRMRFPQVYALKGGTGAWRIAGYGNELESGPGTTITPVSSAAGQVAGVRFAERVATEDQLPFMSPWELKTRQEQSELLYLLDVRQCEEYRAGHIPGARFCSGTQIALLVESLVGVKNATIVTTCDSRARGILAASLLKGMGYPCVSVLDGGTHAWSAQGFSLEVGEPQEIDYGQPIWLSRLLPGLPVGVSPQELPVPGLAEAQARTTFITSGTLHARIATGERLVLLDLRSAGDFATAHVPGARWLSRGRLDLQIERETPDKGSLIVLYCRKGKESTLSALMLKRLGYQHVLVLQDGFEAWKGAGFPTEQGLGAQTEFEELAVAEVGLLGSGPYGYSMERMAKYLKDEEALGEKYRGRKEGSHTAS